MYRKQVRRRRAVLIGLVLLGFVLLTATFGQGSGSAGGGLGTVFGPVQDGASRVLKPGRDLVNWFDETLEARGERERLTKELAESRKQAVAGQVALQENKQLRGMANLQDKAGHRRRLRTGHGIGDHPVTDRLVLDGRHRPRIERRHRR